MKIKGICYRRHWRLNDSKSMPNRVSCGEGGWGGEGFVAVSRFEDDYLLWMAFFDVSNPFEKINVRENVISGVTNLGNTWRFPIDNPERLSIV